jgi:hypothetical protein
MNIQRVKHSTIPVSAFKPEAAKNYRPKVLRWFKDEHLLYPHDCSLRVDEEHGETFVLWAHFVASIPPNIHAGVVATIGVGAESLAQPIVDRIEVSPASGPALDCDFVIFEDSPQVREECRRKGQ